MDLRLDLKRKLHKIIDRIESLSTLQEVYGILQKEVQDEDKAFCKTVDKQAFIKSIEESEARIDKGEFITREDLEKEATNW